MASAVEASGNFPEIFIKPDSNDVISQSARPHLESFALSKPSRAPGLEHLWKYPFFAATFPRIAASFAYLFPPPRISTCDPACDTFHARSIRPLRHFYRPLFVQESSTNDTLGFVRACFEKAFRFNLESVGFFVAWSKSGESSQYFARVTRN